MYPPAGNERPWHLIVLTTALLDEIQFHPHAAMLTRVAAVLVWRRRLKNKGYQLDRAAATQTLLLAAHARVGAVTASIPRRPVKLEVVESAEQVVPFLPPRLSEEKKPVDRFDATRIHDNRW
jgi:hypothetical protein